MSIATRSIVSDATQALRRGRAVGDLRREHRLQPRAGMVDTLEEAAPDPSPRALRKQVQQARRRNAWWIALGGTTAANAVLALALHAGGTGRAMPTQIAAAPPLVFAPRFVFVTQEVAPAAAPTPTPAPPPAAFADLGPCPAPHDERPAGALRQPPPVPDGEPLTGFAGAPTDSRWVATWTADHLFVSDDGGAQWARVLDGPGELVDASFDCHGRVLALRAAGGLGVRDGTRETWRAVPIVRAQGEGDRRDPWDFRYGPQLVGGARAIAVVGTGPGDEVGQAFAVISDDLGVGWRTVDLGWYEGARMTAAWTGDTLRVVVPWTDCMSEGLRLVIVSPRGTRTEEIDEYARELAMSGGTLIAMSGECPADGYDDIELCSWTAARGWKAMPEVLLRDGEDDTIPRIIDGPTDAIVVGQEVHRLTAGSYGRGRAWPAAWVALGTDRAGRLWGVDADGRLVRR